MYWLYVRSTVPWCLFDLYVLAIRKINSTLMSVWPVCIDYTKDQQYLDVCLTCMYWLYERSTVPWCLFDLYVLTIRKINSTLMSVWLHERSTVPWCLFDLYVLAIRKINRSTDQPWCLFDLYVLAIGKINSTLMSVWPVCISYRRSTVPWCLFDLYVLAIGKINSTLMSVWPVCIGYR